MDFFTALVTAALIYFPAVGLYSLNERRKLKALCKSLGVTLREYRDWSKDDALEGK